MYSFDPPAGYMPESAAGCVHVSSRTGSRRLVSPAPAPPRGRGVGGEGPGSCRPGYGKYDRALGVQYMLGVWDLLDRLDEEKKKG